MTGPSPLADVPVPPPVAANAPAPAAASSATVAPDLDPTSVAVPATVALETLTDEELAVLSVTDSVVVTPFLSEVPPKERSALLRTAYRGLLARGIVDPPTREARREAEAALAARRAEASEAGRPLPSTEGAEIDLQVRRDVLTVVTLRQAAPAVIAVARTTAVTQDFVYVHVVDDIVLVEEVSGDGLHRFALRLRDDLVETVLGVALHPEAGPAEGEPVTLSPVQPGDPSPPDSLLEQAGAALLRADLTVLVTGESDPVLHGIFSAPTGCWLFESRRGSGEAVTARPVGPDDVRVLVARAVADLPTVAA